MLHIALYVVTALGIPFFLGYPVVGMLRVKPGLGRVIMAMLVGMAALIVALRSLQYLFPIASIAWWLFATCGVLIVLLWCRASSCGHLARDLRIVGVPKTIVIVALCVGMVIVLNMPTIFYNARSFEGTPNHDSFWYVAVAKFMIGHSFYDKIPLDPAHPVNAFLPYVFGWDTQAGRVGAEGYLAWLSVLFNKDPVLLYNSLSTASALLLSLTSILLLDIRPTKKAKHGKLELLAIIAVFLSPPVFMSVFNSNYSTTFGALIFAAYMATSLMGPYAIHRALPILFCAALVAVYSELVPIAWVCLAIAVGLRWVSHRLSIRSVLRMSGYVLANAIGALILFPWTTISAWFVAKHSFLVAGSNTATYTYPHLPGGLSTRIIAFITTSNGFAASLPHGTSVVLFAILVLAFASGLFLGIRRGSVLAASGIVFVLMSTVLFIHHYSYGLLKAAEYFSPFIMPIMVNGLLCGVVRSSGSLHKYFLSVPGALAVLLFAWSISSLVRTSMVWGQRKSITPSTLRLADAIRGLPRGALVAFGPIQWAYYYTMWLPYLSGRTFLFSGGDSGGYLASYVRSHPFAPTSEASYTVQSSSAWVARPFPVGKVKQFGRLELLQDPGAVRAFTSGLYSVEGSWVWMADSLDIHIDAPASSRVFLNVYLASRFHPAGPVESVTIGLHGRTCTVKIGTHGDGLSFVIDGGAYQTVSIAPNRKGQSPKVLGISSDPRILTYHITELGFSHLPKYKTVACPL